MSDKTKKTDKPDTAIALEAATQAKALAESHLAQCEATFEQRQDADSFSKIVEARSGVELQTRLHGFASNAREAAVRAEAERVLAETERVRLLALAKINADTEENLRAATEACKQIAKTYARGWELAIAEQSVGGPGLNIYNRHVTLALIEAMIAAGNAPSALRFE
jgi:hypothetical protein